ncbi:MAG: hypothetical protein P4L28_12155 [Paludibacteraceae bacterium]|nr:hypothetical protein [Paludibacteraceae bacterium]
MAANFFKIKYLPNADGTDSATALTNTNAVFVHTYQGDDLTGDGTREHPYRSVYKANQKSGVRYIVFRGAVNEYFIPLYPLIGDDINQFLAKDYLPAMNGLYNATTNYPFFNYYIPVYKVIFKNLTTTLAVPLDYRYCLLDSFGVGYVYENRCSIINSTINVLGIATCGNNSLSNNLVIKGFDPYNIVLFITTNPSYISYSRPRYTVFCSSTVFKYKGVNIVQPNLGADSTENLRLIKAAYQSIGVDSSLLFHQDSFGNETCKIVNEARVGGTAKNIFNRYAENLTGSLSAAITAGTALTSITLTVADSSKYASSGDIFIPNSDASGSEVFTYTSVTINSSTSIMFNGTSYTFTVAHTAGCTCTRYGEVLDYNLNPDPLNEALYASDTGSYVGCFKPATPVSSVAPNSVLTPINVNADGSDDVAAGTLLVKNADDSSTFASTSTQTWNRLKSATTITIAQGNKFNGLGCLSQDGSPFGYYFGKHQNLVNATALTPSDTLEANTWYKICNSNRSTYYSILYNGNQYVPDYFFYTGTGPTTFSLQNSDSGTVVKKLLAAPLESIEVLPYDDLTTPSATLPKFSAPLMGDCKMLFYKAGNTYSKAAGTPVLFGDTQVASITDKISYYQGSTAATGWAVTNADQEFVTLSADTTNYYYDYPVLKYLRLSINAHYNSDYDQ